MERDLTTSEVAERLQVSRRTVQRMVVRGEFPNAYQLPGGKQQPYLIPVVDVEQYEEKRRQIGWQGV